MNERDVLEVLVKEEPKVSVAGRASPPAVVIVVHYASGGLTIPLSAATAREVAAELLKYAEHIDDTKAAN